jgi:hypothetical protein
MEVATTSTETKAPPLPPKIRRRAKTGSALPSSQTGQRASCTTSRMIHKSASFLLRSQGRRPWHLTVTTDCKQAWSLRTTASLNLGGVHVSEMYRAVCLCPIPRRLHKPELKKNASNSARPSDSLVNIRWALQRRCQIPSVPHHFHLAARTSRLGKNIGVTTGLGRSLEPLPTSSI